MGLFRKKKKQELQAPVQELEMPPAPKGAEAAGQQRAEGAPLQAPEQGFPEMTFPLPQQMSGIREEPLLYQKTPSMEFGGMEMPLPPPEFYESAERREPAEVSVAEMPTAEVPFDIQKELLSVAGIGKQEQQRAFQEEMHPEEQQEKPYEYPAEKIERREEQKQAKQAGKVFITVAELYEIGEQVMNLADDLTLGKDTAFRLTDLNEQELEQMAKWQVVQQAMEMRVSEIDKLLFKT